MKLREKEDKNTRKCQKESKNGKTLRFHRGHDGTCLAPKEARSNLLIF
jgi:hypothetical protein